ARILVAAPEALHGRHLLEARRAPRGPEVHEHDLAPLLRELEAEAIGRGQREVLGDLRLAGLDEVQMLEREVDAGAGRGSGGRGLRLDARTDGDGRRGL